MTAKSTSSDRFEFSVGESAKAPALWRAAGASRYGRVAGPNASRQVTAPKRIGRLKARPGETTMQRGIH